MARRRARDCLELKMYTGYSFLWLHTTCVRSRDASDALLLTSAQKLVLNTCYVGSPVRDEADGSTRSTTREDLSLCIHTFKSRGDGDDVPLASSLASRAMNSLIRVRHKAKDGPETLSGRAVNGTCTLLGAQR